MSDEKMTVYDVITQRIVDLLESGTVPWRKPWDVNQVAARNGVTHHQYSGVNWFLTNGQAYSSPDWFTFKQLSAANYRIRAGERSTPITFWNFLERKDKDGKDITIPMVRYYRVFNLCQLENVPEEKRALPVRPSGLKSRGLCPKSRPLDSRNQKRGGNRMKLTPYERLVKSLLSSCKKQKLTLYADYVTEDGNVVYRIKERPTFKAIVKHPELRLE